MPDQKISWGWVARIWWGVMWRWILGIIAFALLFRLTFALTRLAGYPVFFFPSSSMKAFLVFALFFGGLGAALAATLRVRHGGFHLALVSAEDQAAAFE